LKKIDFLKNSKTTLKVVWIFFSYVSIISSIYYLIVYESIYFELAIITILFYLSIFNFKIHKLYENYTSFFFFFISLYFNIFYIYYNFIYLNNHNDLNIVYYGFTVSLLTILSTYIYNFKRIYDYYIMFLISLIISIASTLYFFYKNEFDFFSLWIILLLDSIMIFISYYKLKQKDLN
jgi:hypothetical protein